MDVLILATKNCNHRPILEKQLNKMGVSYRVVYFDDYPHLIRKFSVHHSPNLVINGKPVFKAKPGKSLPTEEELSRFFQK